MNIALGFGSTEKDFAENEMQFVRDWCADYEKEHPNVYWSEESFVSALKLAIGERAKKYKSDDEKYKTATEYPNRYSYFWFTVYTDTSSVVVVFDIHHINRRHALSPDGWALMVGEYTVRVRRDY